MKKNTQKSYEQPNKQTKITTRNHKKESQEEITRIKNTQIRFFEKNFSYLFPRAL